ncbi:hypothetical protein N4T77_15725 [Clostridium sp. CX1]|nr:hypothetical protein [Clostridium sp. CX1]MCT8978042.1 hypothetical protein [Clostridium sp. CX1]
MTKEIQKRIPVVLMTVSTYVPIYTARGDRSKARKETQLEP